MVEKVNVAIFGSDLQVTKIKKYEVDESGSKIRINPKGGKGHFMPAFTNSSYLDFPTFKKYILFGDRQYKRVYVVRKMASACVDFFTPFVPMPDPKQVMEAANSPLIKNFGREETGTPWYVWPILIFSLLSFLLILGTSGVLR
jgi:hypothetical protein